VADTGEAAGLGPNSAVPSRPHPSSCAGWPWGSSSLSPCRPAAVPAGGSLPVTGSR